MPGINHDPVPSRRELQYLYENAACGYLTVGPDALIVRINATALAWLGYSREGFPLPRPLSALLSAPDIAEVDRAVQSFSKTGSDVVQQVPVSVHVELIRSDGLRFPALVHVSWSGKRQQIDLAVFNLAQYEELVESLARSKHDLERMNELTGLRLKRLDAIVSTAPEAIISIDADQQIIFANPAASNMFGCPVNEMIDTHIGRFIPERYRKDHASHIEQFRDSGVTVRNMAGSLTVMGVRANGQEFPLEASISQIEIEGLRNFTVVLRDVTIRVQAEEELQRTRERLRMLTARLTSVREEEQRHVARELHDDIGQRLSALKMDIAALRNDLPGDAPGLFDIVEGMDELVSSTVTAVRRLATGLRPKILDELGLAPALESYLTDIESRFSIECTLAIDETVEVPESLSITAFRVVQEAVHNVAKHANASTIQVGFKPQGDGWLLSIRDDGRGMERQDEMKEGSLGLTSMRERVTMLGGSMKIHSAQSQGTLIECLFPPLSPDKIGATTSKWLSEP